VAVQQLPAAVLATEHGCHPQRDGTDRIGAGNFGLEALDLKRLAKVGCRRFRERLEPDRLSVAIVRSGASPTGLDLIEAGRWRPIGIRQRGIVAAGVELEEWLRSPRVISSRAW
jgi:hypothetical protein